MKSLVLLSLIGFWSTFAEIPLPANMFHPGSIMVTDLDQCSHAIGLQICKIFLDPKHVNNNALRPCTYHDIGEAIHLAGGTYVLSLMPLGAEKAIHNSSTTIATLEEGQQLTIPLIKKAVAKSPQGHFTIRLFRDLKNTEEQDRFLQMQWYSGLPDYSVNNLFNYEGYACRGKALSAVAVKVCRAVQAKNYEGLRDAFEFNEDGYGRVDIANGGQNFTEHSSPAEVTNLHDSDIIAVFPGVYQAEFSNSVGDKPEIVRGIDFGTSQGITLNRPLN